MLRHILIVLLAVFLIEIVKERFSSDLASGGNETIAKLTPSLAPKFWLSQLNPNSSIFESIEKVLIQLGLERVEVNESTAETIDYSWDLLWTFEDMARIPIKYSKLEHYQRINHIPGIGTIASKSYLALHSNSIYVPQGFINETSLREFAEKNPETRFVQKLKGNRGVSLKKVSEMNFTNTGNLKTDYFAQVFVEDPLLIGGHKFDFSTYVAITSVDPLRVYYYSKTYHMRFCSQPYDPNNFDDIDSYVVHDNNIPGLDFPEILEYFNKSYVAKDAVHMILTELGHDPQELVKQVEDCIHSIVMNREPNFIRRIDQLKPRYGKNHFFELLRFDFIVDSKLKVHLMEVNMSPNLVVHKKIFRSRHLIENVLYNFFNLVGIGTYMTKQHIRYFDELLFEEVCHVNSLTVLPEICMKPPCINSCDAPECELCWDCLTRNFRWDLKMAYLEHMNRGDMKRVVPPSNVKSQVICFQSL